MRRRPGDAKVAIGYLRVSTDEQKLGPAAQLAAIEVWAAREGVRLITCFTDSGVSGGSDLDDRPGFVDALARVRVERAGAFVVARRDRLARDVYIAATLERAVASVGARVVCADGVANGDSPADAFLRTILDGAAEYERALIRARTRSALQAKKLKGERLGVLPFGYRVASDGKTLEPHPCEQRVVEFVIGQRRRGMSIRAIAAACRAGSVVSRSGRPLTPTQVHRIVSARG